MVFIKVHKSYRLVVAICDSDLIGKKFHENTDKGVKQLDIRESFYKGEEYTADIEKKAIEFIQFQSKEDATFNIVGEKSISLCIKAGIINESSVAKIENIPYALVLL